MTFASINRVINDSHCRLRQMLEQWRHAVPSRGWEAYHLNLLPNAYLTFEEGYPHITKCPQNCPPSKSFVGLPSELNLLFFVCDKFISKTNKNVITKFFYFNYIVRKLLHYTTLESTLLKSRTPYLINSLEMNPRETKFSQSFSPRPPTF